MKIHGINILLAQTDAQGGKAPSTTQPDENLHKTDDFECTPEDGLFGLYQKQEEVICFFTV